MSRTITNLALPLVIEEIETVLDRHHYHPYRQAYATPELRQQLIAYVLNTVPAFYAMVDDDGNAAIADIEIVPSTIRQRMHSAVMEGIERILEDNAAWVSQHIPEEQNAACAPSSWFG